MQHTRPYISGKYKRFVFSLNQHRYIYFIILFDKNPQICKAPQFCKISFIIVIFDCFLFQRRLFEGLRWVLMGFLVCFANNEVFLCVQTLFSKFLECFWSQSLQILYSMMTTKKGKDIEVAVGTQGKFCIQAVDLLQPIFLGKVCLGLF